MLRLEEDKAEIFGNEINLDCMSSGHYALEIEDCKHEKVEGLNDEEILVNMLSNDYQSKAEQLVKIHKQFAHPIRATMEQLVTGKNPVLSSILNDNPPALEARSMSTAFTERVNAALSARTAFVEVDSSERLRSALCKKIRVHCETYNQGDRVYFKRGKDNKWHGSGTVIGVDSLGPQQENLKNKKRDASSLGKVDKESEDDNHGTGASGGHIDTAPTVIAENEVPDEVEVNDAIASLPETMENEDHTRRNVARNQSKQKYPKVNDKITCLIWDGDDAKWLNVQVDSRGGKAKGKNKDYFIVKYDDESEGGVHLDQVQPSQVAEQARVSRPDVENPTLDAGVEEFENDDDEVSVVSIPCHLNGEPAVIEAKRKELENLKAFKVFEEVEDTGQCRIRSGWVITEKILRQSKGVKERLVARGNEEQKKVKTDSPTISKMTLIIMFAMTAQFGWRIESSDVTAAFVQGASIDREVFVTPPQEADTRRGYLWKLSKPVYGLDYACRNFYLRIAEKLGCVGSKDDGAFFIYKQDGVVHGLIGMHVDDIDHTDTEEFYEKVMKPLRSYFKFGMMSKEAFKYVGWNISHEGNDILIDQGGYIEEKIEQIDVEQKRKKIKNDELTEEEKDVFRSAVGKGRWLTDQTRPDCSFDELELSMVTNRPKVSDLLKVSKMFLKFHQDKVTLRFKELGNLKDMKLSVFSDASHANPPDGKSSGMGFLIFLSTGCQPGRDSPCSLLSWASSKLRRKVTSTLAAETFSLLAALEQAIVNCNQNGEVIDRKPKIEAFIDNNDAYEAVYSLKQEMKGRLRIDIACIKEMVAEKRGGFCYLDSCITPVGGLPYQEGCIYQSSSQDSQQRMLLTLERKGLDVYILHMKERKKN